MSMTLMRPVNCWQSGRSMANFFCWMVSVRSARMMCEAMLKLLSSQNSPDGMSMLTTLAGLWLTYFTNEAKPLISGLLSPVPNKPSTTSVSGFSSGGSKFIVISVNCTLRQSMSRCLLVAQSGDSSLWMLKR